MRVRLGRAASPELSWSRAGAKRPGRATTIPSSLPLPVSQTSQLVPVMAVLLSKQTLSTGFLVHKMGYFQRQGKNFLDGVLIQGHRKPQRVRDLFSSRVLILGVFFFSFLILSSFRECHLPFPFYIPHTLGIVYSPPYVHSDMPSCPSLPAPLPLMAVL